MQTSALQTDSYTDSYWNKIMQENIIKCQFMCMVYIQNDNVYAIIYDIGSRNCKIQNHKRYAVFVFVSFLHVALYIEVTSCMSSLILRVLLTLRLKSVACFCKNKVFNSELVLFSVCVCHCLFPFICLEYKVS